MQIEIVHAKKYIYQVSNRKIQPGDMIMNINAPDQIPYRVRHWFTIKSLLKHRRVIIAHKPIDDAPIIDGIPLLEY